MRRSAVALLAGASSANAGDGRPSKLISRPRIMVVAKNFAGCLISYHLHSLSLVKSLDLFGDL